MLAFCLANARQGRDLKRSGGAGRTTCVNWCCQVLGADADLNHNRTDAYGFTFRVDARDRLIIYCIHKSFHYSDIWIVIASSLIYGKLSNVTTVLTYCRCSRPAHGGVIMNTGQSKFPYAQPIGVAETELNPQDRARRDLSRKQRIVQVDMLLFPQKSYPGHSYSSDAWSTAPTYFNDRA
jgi:hypothetical protein